MGRPKALLELDGRPLVAWHCEALAAVANDVVVVEGAVSLGHAVAAGARTVLNRAWATTEPRHSLLLGIADLDPHDEVIVTPVDVPVAPANVLAALVAVTDDVVASRGAVVEYLGAPGHPIRVGVGLIRRVLATGTLQDATANALRVPVSWPGAVWAWNTEGEWKALAQALKSSR
jgi:CTP:molybdopterin cytidylyltransferase MocA